MGKLIVLIVSLLLISLFGLVYKHAYGDKSGVNYSKFHYSISVYFDELTNIKQKHENNASASLIKEYENIIEALNNCIKSLMDCRQIENKFYVEFINNELLAPLNSLLRFSSLKLVVDHPLILIELKKSKVTDFKYNIDNLNEYYVNFQNLARLFCQED